MIKLHYFPTLWKFGTVISIHKTRKSPNDPSSYQTIGLLFFLSLSPDQNLSTSPTPTTTSRTSLVYLGNTAMGINSYKINRGNTLMMFLLCYSPSLIQLIPIRKTEPKIVVSRQMVIDADSTQCTNDTLKHYS